MAEPRIRNVRPKPGYVFDGKAVIPAAQIQDGLANVVTGRGTSVDRSVYNRWIGNGMPTDQIESAYRTSWLVRQIVDIPATDQTRAGRDWDAKKDVIGKIEAEEKRLGYWQKVRKALIYGRLGGGALFINLGDDPARPLPNNVRPGQIVSLIPLYRTQLAIGKQIDDVLNPLFGEPEEFRLNTQARPVIHPTRLIIFKGNDVPGFGTTSWEDRFWGDSVVQAVNEAVQNATTATAGFASLIDEAKVDVFFFDQLAQTLATPNGETLLAKRINVATQEKSMHRSISLDGNDKWETRTLNFAGAKDMITSYLAIVAGASDIPATRLLGKSPDGMNATGEGDLQNYYDSIAAQQEDDLRPQLERLDRVVLPSAGVGADLTWRFSPVRTLTKQQAAEIENKEADTLVKIVSTGLFDEVALEEAYSNRMVESQRWPGYEDARKADRTGASEEDDLGIVPTEGGDPASRGEGGNRLEAEPPRRAANDGTGGAPTGGHPFEDYNPHQRRDRNGRWTGGAITFIAEALGLTPPKQGMPIGKPTQRTRKKLASLGIRNDAKSIGLDSSTVRHIMARHGTDSRGQKAITDRDIAKAARVLNRGDLTHGTPRIAKNGAPVVFARAQLDGHTYEAAFEVRKYRIVPISMRKR